MIYENGKDRQQQELACFQLQRHLTALGVTGVSVTETPEHRRECYDAELRVNNLWTTVIEIKTRDIDMDTLREWGSILIETERLKKLAALFYKASAVTGKRFWNKEVIFLWRLKRDNTAFAINLRRVRELWKDLEKAPESMLKDNHGEYPCGKHGRLIPFDALERVE